VGADSARTPVPRGRSTSRSSQPTGRSRRGHHPHGRDGAGRHRVRGQPLQPGAHHPHHDRGATRRGGPRHRRLGTAHLGPRARRRCGLGRDQAQFWEGLTTWDPTAAQPALAREWAVSDDAAADFQLRRASPSADGSPSPRTVLVRTASVSTRSHRPLAACSASRGRARLSAGESDASAWACARRDRTGWWSSSCAPPRGSRPLLPRPRSRWCRRASGLPGAPSCPRDWWYRAATCRCARTGTGSTSRPTSATGPAAPPSAPSSTGPGRSTARSTRSRPVPWTRSPSASWMPDGSPTTRSWARSSVGPPGCRSSTWGSTPPARRSMTRGCARPSRGRSTGSVSSRWPTRPRCRPPPSCPPASSCGARATSRHATSDSAGRARGSGLPGGAASRT